MSEESGSEEVSIDSTEAEDFGESEEINDEGSEELESEESDEEVESEEESAPEEKEEQLYTTVVNGREEKVTLEQLLGERQKARASSEKFQAAAARIKEAEEKEQQLLSDPVSVMRAGGMSEADIKKFFYEQTTKFLDDDELDPEQKRIAQIEAENAKFKADAEAHEKELQTKAEQAEQAKLEGDLEKEFMSALDTHKVPVTPAAIQRMAAIMYTAASNNYDMSAEEAAEYYKEEQEERLSSQLGGLDSEQLERLIGKEASDKLRKHSISKIKNPPAKKNLPKESKPKPGKKRSMESFFS